MVLALLALVGIIPATGSRRKLFDSVMCRGEGLELETHRRATDATGWKNVLGVSCTCIKKHQNWMKKEQFQLENKSELEMG
jgi:peroxiredoxin